MNNDRTDGVARGWHDLGPYRILAMGLHLNPYYTTHRIHRAGKFIGAQLSVPTLDDCRWHEHQAGTYAQPTNRPAGYSAKQVWRRGRLTNAERALRDAALLQPPIEEPA